MKNELVKTVEETGIELEKAKSIWSEFEGFFDAINECAAKVENLEIIDVSQKSEMKLARETRIELKKSRVAADKTRKLLKESVLKEGRFIDRVYGLIADSTKPVEEDLLKKENFAKEREAKRKAALKMEREATLQSLGVDTTFFFLDTMSDEDFEGLLELSTRNHEAALARERAAEEKRIAREKAEAEERAKLAAENERLRKESEAREQEMAEEMARVEEARRAAEEVARKEREAREAVERAEREKKEAELAKVRAEKEAAEAKILEAEEAERAEQQAIADERARLELAGDKEKLTVYIEALLGIDMPSLTSAAAAGILVSLNECHRDAEEEAKGL